MSRTGDNDGAQTVGVIDPTARIVAGLIRSRAEPFISSINQNGDVRFALPIRPSKITRADLLAMPMVRTNSFVDFIGEYLVRKHFGRFETVILRPDYKRLVKSCQHLHFGFWFDDGALSFQFHASFLHQLFNRELKEVLIHESVENQ